MPHQVVVTRRGQTTIPASIRKKLAIEEGTVLKAETDGERVNFTKVPSLLNLAGTSKLTRQQAFRLLDKLREE